VHAGETKHAAIYVQTTLYQCVCRLGFYQWKSSILPDLSLQGRKKVMKMLKQQLGERRNAAEREAVDFFDVVIDEMDRPGSEMSESIALDLLFLMLFASHETTSIGLTAILKFLTDNPKALQELAVSEIIISDHFAVATSQHC